MVPNPKPFGIVFHHGGNFIPDGKFEKYIGGERSVAHGFDPDRFGYFDLMDELKKLGFERWSRLSFEKPWSVYQVHIKGDAEVMQMISLLSQVRARMCNVYIVDERKCEEQLVSDNSIGGRSSVLDSMGSEGMKQSVIESVGEGVGEGMRDGAGGDVGDGADAAMGEGVGDVDAGMGEGVMQTDMGLFHDSDEDDGNYIPSCGEDETDDDMDAEELVSEDEEYTQGRMKVKEKKIFVITDDMFFGIADGGLKSDYISEYENSEEDNILYSDSTDSEDEGRRKRDRHAKVMYDPRCDHKTLKFTVGMGFVDGFQARDALTDNAVENGWQIHFKRANKTQFEAACQEPCLWFCSGSLSTKHQAVIIKRLENDHTCPRAMRNKIVTSTWIARKYLHVFRLNPALTCKDLGRDLMERFAFDATKWRLYHAKRKAIDMLVGTVEDHYAKLRSYTLELGKSDVEGRFELHVNVGAVFKAMYIGFSGLRKGRKEGCRRVIGLDGAFLKTYLGGILLSAVGTDGNSQMYPIAWAVVEVENEVCWSWFVNILTQDLNLGDGEGITILSDQQKGLENAVKDLLPMAEHRNCARHIYANWKKTHKGPALKQHFWKIVRSTYMEEYDGACHELEKEDGQAYADLMDKNPSKFCKAFLTPVQCSDAILNNVCECFNSYILEARNKHIIDMLEEIRIALMERLYRKNVEIKSAERSSSICPKIRKKIEAMVYESRNCTTIPAIGGKFEVKHFQDRFVVIPTLRKCGCRKWELTGIPCVHGCAVINFLKQNMDDYVNEWFSVGKYKLAYGYGLPALNGEKLWPAAEGLPVIPPPIRKMPGRPKKVRRRDPYEKEPERPNKLRKTCQMTCQNCFQEGHNSRTCKNDTVHLPPKPKGKKGRPRKAPLQSTTPATTAIPGRGRGGGRGGGGRGGGRGGGGRGGGRGGSIPTQESNTNT